MLVKKHIYIILKKNIEERWVYKNHIQRKDQAFKICKKKKETGKFPEDAPVGSRQAPFPTKETLIQSMEVDT